jgi:hypothetical protein
MKYIFIIILLSTHIITFGQNEKYDYPDTLMVYGTSIGNYGLAPTNPIKVGGGKLPKHVYRYLNSIVDSNGAKLKYERIGSCCNKEIGRDKPLTSFKIFNSNSKEVILYFDQYQWNFPKVINIAQWKEQRKGYYGEYKNDTVFNGYGIYFFKDGGYYQGNWKLGIMEGKGKMYIPEQETYVGGFKDGEYHGYGEIEYVDGGKYQGNWIYGKRQGKGILQYPHNLEILSIEGPFENDKPKGKFKVTYRNGKIEDQEF